MNGLKVDRNRAAIGQTELVLDGMKWSQVC